MTEKGKALDLSDVPAVKEWVDVPAHWKVVGKRQTQTRMGRPATVVQFLVNDKTVDVFDFALKRERGGNFQILDRILSQMDPATG